MNEVVLNYWKFELQNFALFLWMSLYSKSLNYRGDNWSLQINGRIIKSLFTPFSKSHFSCFLYIFGPFLSFLQWITVASASYSHESFSFSVVVPHKDINLHTKHPTTKQCCALLHWKPFSLPITCCCSVMGYGGRTIGLHPTIFGSCS